MKTEQPNRPFTEEEKNAGINRIVGQPQQKYTVWVDEFLVDDAPYPDHERRSTHECYESNALSLSEASPLIEKQIIATYNNEMPPEVVGLKVVGIFAVGDDSNSVVDTEVGRQAEPSFVKEIERVINSFSKENDSNTPDFILAEYLNNCLNSFTTASQAREKWYAKDLANTKDNSEAAIGQRCYDLIEHIEQQCADYRKIVKTGRMTGWQHLTDKEFETLSARITPAFHDIAIDGVKKAKADVLRKLRIIFDNIIDNRS